MNHHLRIHFFFLWTGLLFLLFLSSCSTTRDLGKNEFLLSKTRIKIDKPKIGVSDLQGFIMQKPNTKTLGLLRLKLYTYQVTSRGRETRFKRWILRSIAEKPVILDTHLCNTSGRHMKTYMNNIGYFHSVVSTEYHYHRKLAGVTYKIKSGQPYLLRNINMTFQDDTIRALVEKEKDNTLLRKGHPYNVYTLDEERARITNLLKNKGYYYFSKDYISFQVDSSLNSNEIDLTLLLSNPQLLLNDSTSARVGIRHIPYYLGNVSVYPDYEPFAQDTTAYDTLGFYSTTNVKGKLISRYFYIYKNDLKIRPRTITQNIFLTPGSLFRLDDVDQTYTRLSDLHFFRFVNIEFNPLSSRIQPQDVKSGVLDCNIKLSRNKVMALSLETEGTNSGGDYGLAANVVFENRNIFRGVEQLDVKLKGAMEMQKRFGEFNSSAKTLFFNTYETGVQVSLIFPKFLVPMNPERFPRYFRPKTTINSGFNFQERSGFRRYLAELTFGYDWKESQYKRHILNPIEINSIRIFPDSTFTAYLNSINDRRLTDQYTDHLVMALRYSYIFNNQRINRKGNFFYLKSNFESAGNLSRATTPYLGFLTPNS
ncbi:MAG: hypothetical protein NTU44_06175 [Bacteroidetes bacterium]|nr:hypothetical protein [Bacteroidota bacterium]